MLELVASPGRLDSVVVDLTGASRADVQRAIATGRVRVDGRIRSKSHRLAGGEKLEVDLSEQELAPERLPVPVRFEDQHIMVVVHPTASRRTGTLVNRLLGMGTDLAPAGGPLRPGIVHRLDVGTSGLMVVAKTDEAFALLAGMFAEHRVDRSYVALVRGGTANQSFVVDAPLGGRASKVVVDRTGGRAAQTSVEVIERFDRATLLGVRPRTGRTHQIRVHLAAVGHPILGDKRYGGWGPDASDLGLSRPFLHSARVSFAHPMTGETMISPFSLSSFSNSCFVPKKPETILILGVSSGLKKGIEILPSGMS